MRQEQRYEQQARHLLESWLEKPRAVAAPRDFAADFAVASGPVRFVVEVKADGSAAPVSRAAANAKLAAKKLRAVPVVAVPFMGGAGKRICEETGVSWFDLSGNAHIVAPGHRILIEGKPNRFLRQGRPSSAFAPKSARIARHLLIDPRRFIRQQELAREVDLDDGFTSRIVSRLDEGGFIERSSDGAIRPRDPYLLLDAWAEDYSFDKHGILRGHVALRTSEEVLSSLSRALRKAGRRYAATGLAAAWLHTSFAGFRVVTLFVEHELDAVFLHEAGFREEPRGANVWMVVPNDDGVFDGATTRHEIACVHPVQAYLDLLGHPERAREAADELRSRLLRWTS